MGDHCQVKGHTGILTVSRCCRNERSAEQRKLFLELGQRANNGRKLRHGTCREINTDASSQRDSSYIILSQKSRCIALICLRLNWRIYNCQSQTNSHQMSKYRNNRSENSSLRFFIKATYIHLNKNIHISGNYPE